MHSPPAAWARWTPRPGASEPWAINTVVEDGSTSGKCGITDLSVDANMIYGGGFSYGCGNFEGTFAANPTTGAAVWINDCHGDTYSTQPDGRVLYVASHSHDCSAIGQFPDASPQGGAQRATAYTTVATGGTDTGPDSYGWNYNGQPDSTLLDWFPTLAIGAVTGQDQAAWSVTGNSKYIAYGGEFPSVNGTAQQGLVRFAIGASAPNKVGPIASTAITPTASSTSYGEVGLSWTATWDRDNAKLTYTILRDGRGRRHAESDVDVLAAAHALLRRQDGLTPGTSHTYRIRVTDPLGNRLSSGTSAAVTVSDAGGPPATAPVLGLRTTTTGQSRADGAHPRSVACGRTRAAGRCPSHMATAASSVNAARPARPGCPRSINRAPTRLSRCAHPRCPATRYRSLCSGAGSRPRTTSACVWCWSTTAPCRPR